MAEELHELVRQTRDKVTEMHTTLLGRGGVVDRIEVLEAKAERHGVFVTKVTAIVGATGAAIGIASAWVKDWFFGR